MWAMEAIPTMAYLCSTVVAPIDIPRCLARKFKNPSSGIDFNELFRKEVLLINLAI